MASSVTLDRGGAARWGRLVPFPSEFLRDPVNLPAGAVAVPPPGQYAVVMTFDVRKGGIRFEWCDHDGRRSAAGLLTPQPREMSFLSGLQWVFEGQDALGAQRQNKHCPSSPNAVHALLRRIRQLRPLALLPPRVGILTDRNVGRAQADCWLPVAIPAEDDPWLWIGREAVALVKLMTEGAVPMAPGTFARDLLHLRVSQILGVAGPVPRKAPTPARPVAPILRRPFHLEVDMDRSAECTRFTWRDPIKLEVHATGTVRCGAGRQFLWCLAIGGNEEKEVTPQSRESIHRVLAGWYRRIPTLSATQALYIIRTNAETKKQERKPLQLEDPAEAYPVIEESLLIMAEELNPRRRPPLPVDEGVSSYYDLLPECEAYQRRLERKEQKRAEEAARRETAIRRYQEERHLREEREDAARRATEVREAAARKTEAAKPGATPAVRPRPVLPAPPISVTIKLPDLQFQDTALPLGDLRGFNLCERAALWWVSNQSDDLLCLPYCRLEHLEYQIRTALRVLGPLRGRALLSDEVGLGKTIEAGLVLKELLTRGMVKRFLILTLPSLVDQWAEELDDKFGLTTATTNQPGSRDEPTAFWRDNAAIVASLHTLKQTAHLEIARQLQWDLLIVDEAHYLRNRESQAWQAVNLLPRQFLLLLTATPVQNSLEEVYNLVTLLMPGQLPTPREFRARFLDPKRPRQPRSPEELRRLLGQVMIRNTRASAGVSLPPRRAETALFAPAPAENAFWVEWEAEFRAELGRLSASQASLWGRLLLRAAGSSPAAWRDALKKFPSAGAAKEWRERAPLETSWQKKCELLLPMVRGSGGAVIFTEFLETQASVAAALGTAGVPVFVINGATPPLQRQPITERFRETGGALILTHSGTEGRNLQFCHRLANFDLPWNPMVIEQRIGRLHRLGQRHPVEIHNFVQTGTLQEHLLRVLQEKLNLFELVVGETGLVLGETYSGDEFEEEIYRRWRENAGGVGQAIGALGDELAAARQRYGEVKDLDATLFAQDYESL